MSPARPARTASDRPRRPCCGELLAASAREDATAFLALLDAADARARAATEPRWVAWRHALTARRSLVEGDPDAAPRRGLRRPRGAGQVPAVGRHRAGPGLPGPRRGASPTTSTRRCCSPSTPACSPRARPPPSRPRRCCRRTAGCRWRSSGLDLEELAVAHAMRGQHVAAALRRARRPVADAAALRPAAHRAGPDPAPPRRRRAGAGAGRRGHRRRRRGPRARLGARAATRPTCSTSSRRGR